MIVELQAFEDRRQGLARCLGQRIAFAIVVDQAVVDDRLSDRLATATAHGARLSVDVHGQLTRERQRLTTMVTILGFRHGCPKKKLAKREKRHALCAHPP